MFTVYIYFPQNALVNPRESHPPRAEDEPRRAQTFRPLSGDGAGHGHGQFSAVLSP